MILMLFFTSARVCACACAQVAAAGPDEERGELPERGGRGEAGHGGHQARDRHPPSRQGGDRGAARRRRPPRGTDPTQEDPPPGAGTSQTPSPTFLPSLYPSQNESTRCLFFPLSFCLSFPLLLLSLSLDFWSSLVYWYKWREEKKSKAYVRKGVYTSKIRT